MTAWRGSRGPGTFPADWRKRRARRAAMAGGRCECDGACGRHPHRCNQPGSECDHHDDDYTNHNITNLRWLCHECHLTKTLAKAKARKAQARTSRMHPAHRAVHPGLI